MSKLGVTDALDESIEVRGVRAHSRRLEPLLHVGEVLGDGVAERGVFPTHGFQISSWAV
jgi:hypothetical protein